MADSNIQVLPGYFQLNLKPGDTKVITSTLKNNFDRDISLDVSLSNISIYDLIKKESGSELLQSIDSIYPSSWIKSFSSRVTIPANSAQEVVFEIKLPSYAKIEEYYPVIVYSQESNSDTSLGVDIKMASVVYLNIDSDTQEKGGIEIAEFAPLNNIVFNPQADIEIKLNNNTNSFIFPTGSVSIYDNNGVRQESTLKLNSNYKFILPTESYGEILSWQDSSSFSLIPKFGTYKLVAEVRDDINNKSLILEREITIVPILHILAILAIFLLCGIFLKKKLRKVPRK